MTKRRKKVTRKKSAGPSARSTGGANARSAANRSWELSVVAGSRDRDAAWRYLERFMEFENGILHNSLDRLDLDAVPPEHKYLLSRWPDAFEFFRHSMWSYAERVIGMNPWTSTIRSMMVRAFRSDATGFQSLNDAVSLALPKFQVQRNNVLHQVQDDPSLSDRERFRLVVKLYADMYEVDFPLWLIAVPGKAYRTGRVDPQAFGGPDPTAVAQGSLIDAATKATEGTPLEPLVRRCYIPELRNAINHNAYELLFGGPDGNALAHVRDSDSGVTWAADEVRDAWQDTADLMNAVMSAAASVASVLAPTSATQFADCGVIAINYAVVDDVPHAIVAQLWCFRDLDPTGSWLDDTGFMIEQAEGGEERAGFTSRAFMQGASLSDQTFGEALRDRGWVRVIRIPVAPDLDMGFPVFEHVVSGRYEVVGPSDEHDVPFRTASVWPRAVTLVDQISTTP